MIRVQLDENINARKLANACNSEGRSQVRRFPPEWRGQGIKDPDVLERFLADDALLLTTDENIALDHDYIIPDRHPGIIIVQQADAAVRTMTWRISQAIIADLKSVLIDWDSVVWNNSVVTLRPTYVEVRHAEAGRLKVDDLLQRNIAGWEDALRNVLLTNSTAPWASDDE